MSTHEQMLAEIRRSPRLPEIVDELQADLRKENERRKQFYQEMTPDEKVEFIDGEVLLHSPAKLMHLTVTKWIAVLLNTYVDLHELGVVAVEKCLVVFPRNDYEPDVVFFSNAKAASLSPDTMKFPVPDLVVEVLSKSTQDRDRGVKFEDYQNNGVGEYWIVDADRGLVEQYVLVGETYELRMKSATGLLQSQVIQGFATEVSAFFDKQENMAALRKMMS